MRPEEFARHQINRTVTAHGHQPVITGVADGKSEIRDASSVDAGEIRLELLRLHRIGMAAGHDVRIGLRQNDEDTSDRAQRHNLTVAVQNVFFWPYVRAPWFTEIDAPPHERSHHTIRHHRETCEGRRGFVPASRRECLLERVHGHRVHIA
ncbi:hypothetical protein D3C80_1258710 [compost metagenome]